MDGFTTLSLALTELAQSWGPGFVAAVEALSWLGREEFYLLVMPIILWSFDYMLGLRLGVVLLLANGLNSVGKLWLRQPRPSWVSETIQAVGPAENSFGMPSGHAQISTSIYGFLIVQFKARWFRIAMVVLIVAIGLSRIVLGMHFVQDVLVGWAVGLAMLLIYLRYEGAVVRWVLSRAPAQQYLLALLGGMLIAALGWLALNAGQGWTMPAEWAQLGGRNASADEPFNPLNLDAVLTSAGAIAGLWWGFLWHRPRGGVSSAGSWWQRALRFPVGLVGVLILWIGLGSVFPDSADLLGYSLRFLRYLLLGVWISGAAPWVFQKMKLTA